MELSYRRETALQGSVSYGQQWKTGTGRQYLYILYFANTVQHKVDKLKQSKKARTIRTIYRVKTIK